MNRSLAVLIVFALILAACATSAPTAAPAPQQPQQPPAMAQPTQPSQPAAPAPLPTMKATGGLPELRPPRSGGQLNPPTLAPTTSSRPIAGAANWQTYRDNSLGLSFQYPPDWRQSITTSATRGILQRIEVTHLNQPAGNNAEVLIDIRKSQGDLLTWLKQELPTGRMFDAAYIEGGLNGVKSYNARIAGMPAIFIYAPEHGSGTPAMAALFVVDNQSIYQFTYSGDIPDNLTNRAIYWQLLNTVAFTRTVTPGLTLLKTSFTTGVITSTVVP
jgi:hypothetical protein